MTERRRKPATKPTWQLWAALAASVAVTIAIFWAAYKAAT